MMNLSSPLSGSSRVRMNSTRDTSLQGGGAEQGGGQAGRWAVAAGGPSGGGRGARCTLPAIGAGR